MTCSTRRRAHLAAVLVGALLAAACGIGPDDEMATDASAAPATIPPDRRASTTVADHRTDPDAVDSERHDPDPTGTDPTGAVPTGADRETDTDDITIDRNSNDTATDSTLVAASDTIVSDDAMTRATDTEDDTMTNEPAPTTAAPVLSADGAGNRRPVGTGSGCRRIFDFDDDTARGGPIWVVVNDGVMGGRSNGVIGYDGSTMRFSGTVVTDGGGFTSVRRSLDGGEMAGTTSVSMRVRADDRVYGLTLEDDARIDGRSVSHRADLDTSGDPDADGWVVVTLDYAELQPSIFGRSVDAPPFDPAVAREFGIIIADATDGEFSLDVDWIDACE